MFSIPGIPQYLVGTHVTWASGFGQRICVWNNNRQNLAEPLQKKIAYFQYITSNWTPSLPGQTSLSNFPGCCPLCEILIDKVLKIQKFVYLTRRARKYVRIFIYISRLEGSCKSSKGFPYLPAYWCKFIDELDTIKCSGLLTCVLTVVKFFKIQIFYPAEKKDRAIIVTCNMSVTEL